MSSIDASVRLSLNYATSVQNLYHGVFDGLLNVLSPDIRNVVLVGHLPREHFKLLGVRLREEYQKYGVTIENPGGPIFGDTLDLHWPGTDMVTTIKRQGELSISWLREFSFGTVVVAITSQALFTTELFDFYDVTRQVGIRLHIYTTGYIPELGPLQTLKSFAYTDGDVYYAPIKQDDIPAVT